MIFQGMATVGNVAKVAAGAWNDGTDDAARIGRHWSMAEAAASASAASASASMGRRRLPFSADPQDPPTSWRHELNIGEQQIVARRCANATRGVVGVAVGRL